MDELKGKIENEMESLGKSIEKFCVIENREYTQVYKDKLWNLHKEIEDILNY